MTAHTEPPAVAPPGEVAVGEHDGPSGFSTSFDASRSRGEATAGSTTGPSAPAAPPADGHRRSPLAWLLLRLVALYRATAPFRAPRCRFHPTCSTYAVVAIERHGARRGSWLALRRLGRCHPWNPGGVDHVPPRK